MACMLNLSTRGQCHTCKDTVCSTGHAVFRVFGCLLTLSITIKHGDTVTCIQDRLPPILFALYSCIGAVALQLTSDPINELSRCDPSSLGLIYFFILGLNCRQKFNCLILHKTLKMSSFFPIIIKPHLRRYARKMLTQNV